MRSRRDVVALAALLIAFALIAALLRPHAGDLDATDLRASTFRSSPAGTRALYLLLDELDLPVERSLEPFTAEPAGGVLVVLSPAESPTPRDAQALTAWVEAGGTLILAVDPAERELRRLLNAGFAALPMPDTLRSFERQRWQGAAAFPVAHPWTADIDSVRGFRLAFREPTGATVLLRAAGGAPTVFSAARGNGRVIAWSDVNALRNDVLSDGGAALLFARVAAAAAADSGVIRFSEYYQGYRDVGVVAAMRSFIRNTAAGHALLQVVIAGLLLLLLAARRFGAPLMETTERRRSPLEHVQAVAAAYRRADARRTARQLLLSGLERRLGRRILGDDGRITTSALSQTAHAQRLTEEWERGTAGDLAALAGAVDDYIGEVRWT